MGRPPGIVINGDTLRYFREEVAGLTVREVADKASCSPSSYSGIEMNNQKPSKLMLFCICEALGIDVALVTTDQEARDFAADRKGPVEVAA